MPGENATGRDRPRPVAVPLSAQCATSARPATRWLSLPALSHAARYHLMRQFNELDVLQEAVHIECASNPLCQGTAGVFILLYTIGIPLTVFLFLREFLSPKGKDKYKGTQARARRPRSATGSGLPWPSCGGAMPSYRLRDARRARPLAGSHDRC